MELYSLRRKFGDSYIYSLENVSSGLVVNSFDFDTVSEITARLSNNQPRCLCCIAIVNMSGSDLRLPRRYLDSGCAKSMPLEIARCHTGFVTVSKESGSLRGCMGVLTYALLDSDCHLQIMWSVPKAKMIWNLWLNVSVGKESASKSLLRKLYSGESGNLVAVKTDFKHVIYSDKFYAELIVKQEMNLQVIIDLNKSECS